MGITSLGQALLAVAVVIATAQLLGVLARHLGQPRVMGGIIHN
jgi:Kef-type K+ transport system membrane component KefB